MNKNTKQDTINKIIKERIKTENEEKNQKRRNKEFAESFRQKCGKIKVKSIVTNILAGEHGTCKHKKH